MPGRVGPKAGLAQSLDRQIQMPHEDKKQQLAKFANKWKNGPDLSLIALGSKRHRFQCSGG
jgi:hypothetical protein